MIKKYTLHLDAVIAICVLFLVSVLANIYLVQVNRDVGKQLLDAQVQYTLSELNLSSSRDELRVCRNKLAKDKQDE